MSSNDDDDRGASEDDAALASDSDASLDSQSRSLSPSNDQMIDSAIVDASGRDVSRDADRRSRRTADGRRSGSSASRQGAHGSTRRGHGTAVPRELRTTTPYMTKYERARALGARALQISMNAPVLTQLDGESDPLEIASKELRERRIPFVIRRYMPDGSYEDWPIEELIVADADQRRV